MFAIIYSDQNSCAKIAKRVEHEKVEWWSLPDFANNIKNFLHLN